MLKEIIEAEWIFGDIAEQFVDFPEASPLLYRQCNEIYKLMLAYELMTREEEHTFHSMSQLKTNPSINSMKDTITGRRRSTLREKRTSVILNAGSSLSLTNVLKRSAGYFSYEGAIDCKDPLYIIHAKYSAKADRIRLLQTGNSKGEKTI